MNSIKDKSKQVFVPLDIAQKYNVTAGMIFGHIMYHVARHGVYDTAPTATQNYLGISRKTVIKYIKQFITDKLFTEIEGQEEYRSALTPCSERDYYSQFLAIVRPNKAEKQNVNKIQLVNLPLDELSKLKGTKAEAERKRLFCKNLLIDKFASKKANSDNNTENQITFNTWRKLAKTCGVCINTIKVIIEEFKQADFIDHTKKSGKIIFSYKSKIKHLVVRKYNIFKRIIDNRKAKAAKEEINLGRQEALKQLRRLKNKP